MNWTDVVPSLALAIGLAACAGLRAWLPLLLAGRPRARWGIIELGPSFQFLGQQPRARSCSAWPP